MTSVAGYCRVSTDKEDQTNSFVSQKEFFKNYIESRPNWRLYRIYADEGITGTSTGKRMEFNRMLRDAHEGKFQLILTKEISRFSRNILDTIRITRELKDIGVGVVFLTENLNSLNPETEMLLAFMGTMAQEESRRTSVRVKWGQSRSMEKGVVFGNSLLGYRVNNGKIELVPEEAELVRRIFHLYGIEKRSTSEILRILQHDAKICGTNWSANRVVRILKNEKYAGDLVQKKTITPDYLTHKRKINHGEEELIIVQSHHEAIVSRGLWDTVQSELAVRNKRQKKTSAVSSRCFAFSGKVFCGECGAVFLARYKGKGDNRIRVWRCGTAVKQGITVCGVGKLLREDDAAGVLCHLFSVLCRELKDEIIEIAERISLIRTAGRRKNAEKCHQRLVSAEKKKALLIEAMLSERITLDEFELMRMRYDREECVLREKYQSLQNRDIKQITYEEICSLFAIPRSQEVFWREIVERITVYRDAHIEIKLAGAVRIFRYKESAKIEKQAGN